jgi:hypothetical protein
MWYESEMIAETLFSIKRAEDNVRDVIEIRYNICINLQVYIESPIKPIDVDYIRDTVLRFLPNANITYKTDDNPFYNIADWRRDNYDKFAMYNIWLESDCLLPFNYFVILEQFTRQNLTIPHIVTISSRKMWDTSWKPVEYEGVQGFANDELCVPYPFWCGHTITQEELDGLNAVKKLRINEIHPLKIDGALLAISGGVDFPFIPENMHFAHEDTCTERVFDKHGIKQYHISNILKGHNYSHELKRTNTNDKREDNTYKKYKEESLQEFINFIKAL